MVREGENVNGFNYNQQKLKDEKNRFPEESEGNYLKIFIRDAIHKTS